MGFRLTRLRCRIAVTDLEEAIAKMSPHCLEMWIGNDFFHDALLTTLAFGSRRKPSARSSDVASRQS